MRFNVDKESQEMTKHALGYAERKLSDPNLTEKERSRWLRVQRIVKGEPLQEIYPELEPDERLLDAPRLFKLVGIKLR